MDNFKTKMTLFGIPFQSNLHALNLSLRSNHNLLAISAVCLPVASSDSVVESRLSLTTLPGLTFRVLVLFPWEVAAFLWGLCINAVGAGLGRGRGKRPLRALTAAAPGYSPYNYNISDKDSFRLCACGVFLTNKPGCLLLGLICSFGGKPKSDCRLGIGLLGS